MMFEHMHDERGEHRPLRTIVRDLAGIHQRFMTDLLGATLATMRHGPADPAATPLPVPVTDRRFDDAAWTSSRYFHLLQQSHLLSRRLLLETVDALPLKQGDARLLRFLAELGVNAAAPPNFLLGNPTAMRMARLTRGRSLIRGAASFLADVMDNGGLPEVVDDTAFVPGRDVAMTPGKVVFRNQIMEVIQYESCTETAHAIPMLISPPWVNKYYIVDLAPEWSMVRWLTKRGHTVFTISYRNPDAALRDVGFDDYLRDGLLPALAVIGDITGSEEVNITGGCLGGLMALMLAAWLDDDHIPRLRSITTINTLADFADIAELARSGLSGKMFAGPVMSLAEHMTGRLGYLSGRGLDAFFRFLRADDMVWKYVASNWLMGRPPPAISVLAWTSDAMNVPERAQRYLTRDLCLENSFAAGAAELAGRPLRLDRVKQDTFIVAAHDDHIIPWQSAYRTTALFPGDARFFLAAGGHVGSLLASPGYRSGDGCPPPDPHAWLANATEHRETWWQAWAEWLAERAGPRSTPPPIGSARFPAMEDAPGTYVHT
jgi:polyhydroxyalkanoate synthase